MAPTTAGPCLLTTTTCIAHWFSSNFAMSKGFASAIACCYPELQNVGKIYLHNFPPGSLLSSFDKNFNRLVYHLITKRSYFHKSTYGTIDLSLQALKQHLTRHNIQELAIPKLGCGDDQLHWPTVFSILFKVFFSGSNVTITIFQPAR